MIARLVESGQMQWSDSVGERFPDASIHEDWKPVTLRQLLTHTSGAPADFSFQVMLKQPALGPECTDARRKAVMDVLAAKPASPPGKKHAYSNVGYTIAGAMAETATGVSWEVLVKRESLSRWNSPTPGSVRRRARPKRSINREVTARFLVGKSA
jgi:CubicO group peptidase (beta-lactamase class C family)